MAKKAWKPGALLSPVPPTLVSCGTIENPNVLTVAWTGIVNTIPPMTYVSVRPSRYSYPLIQQTGEFVINLPKRNLVKAVDFCGVRSGAKVDKFKECGLTPSQASCVSAPCIAQCPLSLECKVTQEIPLGSHVMFLAEIVAVDIDETLVDEQGRWKLEDSGLLAYSHGAYFELGKQLGTFGFSVRKKKKKQPPRRGPRPSPKR